MFGVTDKKAERVRNLCVLTACWLHSMTTAGLYSMALGDQAIEAAEELLDRIEKGPEKKEMDANNPE